MATAIDELPLTAQQRKNRANQLPQTGIAPAAGIANLASDIGAGAQAGAESMQRGIAQQGRAYQTVGSYLNNGDPVGDAASGIASLAGQAWDGTSKFFRDSAAAARTSDHGQMIPDMVGTPIQAVQQPAQNATAQVPAAPPPQIQQLQSAAAPAGLRSTDTTRGMSNGITSTIMQPATAAGGAVQPTAQQGGGIDQDMFRSGGYIKNERTGRVTQIPGAPKEAPATQRASTPGVGQRGIADGMFDLAASLAMAGEVKRAQALTGVLGAKHSASSSARNGDIAEFTAMSQDEDRRTDREIKRDALDEKKRQNAMREELAALNDENDLGGKKRAALTAKLRVLSGKEQDHFQPVIGKDDLGNPIVLGVFNKQTGAVVDPAGRPIKSKQDVDVAHNDAQAALAKGASKDEVNRRLLAAGFPAI